MEEPADLQISDKLDKLDAVALARLADLCTQLLAEARALEKDGHVLAKKIHAAIDKKKMVKVIHFINQKTSN